jgi:hypothetical protein
MKTRKRAEEAYAWTHVPVRIHKTFFHETQSVNCQKRRRRNTALRTAARYILEFSENTHQWRLSSFTRTFGVVRRTDNVLKAVTQTDALSWN